MKDDLSRIYFDDLPVTLLGDDARPPLARIVRAGGKIPGEVNVHVLASPKDARGHVLPEGEVIDRTVEPTKPIYLRSVPKPTLGPGTMANVDPVIAQLGTRSREMDAREADAGREQAQAAAEDEAEERQEEVRGQEDALQDEEEALRDDEDDRDAQQ